MRKYTLSTHIRRIHFADMLHYLLMSCTLVGSPLYAHLPTAPVFQGTPDRIGDGLCRAHPNHGSESRLLYYTKSNVILAVWRSQKDKGIVSSRCVNGRWESPVDTPYGTAMVDGRHIGGLDADVDEGG